MCRFEFHNGLTTADGEETLLLAVVAAEGLYGRARARLEFTYAVDGNAIAIDTGTEVGTTVARVFTGLLLREHGETAFEVRLMRRDSDPTVDNPCTTKEAAA